MNRLPTKDLLKNIGIPFPLNSLRCAFCNLEMESRNHVFSDFIVVKIILIDVSISIGKPVGFEEDSVATFLGLASVL